VKVDYVRLNDVRMGCIWADVVRAGGLRADSAGVNSVRVALNENVGLEGVLFIQQYCLYYRTIVNVHGLLIVCMSPSSLCYETSLYVDYSTATGRIILKHTMRFNTPVPHEDLISN
jgi:hypothetical protein